MVIELTGSKSKIIYMPLPGGRPDPAPAGHHAGEGEARLGAEGARGRGAEADDRVFQTGADGVTSVL